ncbi:MAG: Gfo/Idh/MocA family oxidoreductase [Candidatus Latescibacterota bacterium]|nr:MAG: Gfo/Idh/MocA family oxidoreductase [Candidatus Latescibacterota bacterium]
MMRTIRWGILGPGAISRKFVVDLKTVHGTDIIAVGSRSQDRATQFASEFDIPRVHASYDALADDGQVDAIYVGTPHTFHKEHTILCLRHGKHVLCEKPFAINAVEAAEMVQVAKEHRCVLMEAMMTRHLPAMVKVRELIADGAIGEVRMITAGFGFRAEFDPKSRLFDPALGAGALLDLGVYPLSLAFMLLGEPATIDARARLGETGVDEEAAVLFGYPDGALAVLTMAIRLDIPREAYILGTRGRIKIWPRWWVPSRISLKKPGGDEQILDLPFKGGGYAHEAEAFMDVIRSGRLESEVMSLDESLSIMRTMDTIRAQWGLRYPVE